NIAEPRQPIIREPPVENPSMFKFNRLKQRTAEGHDIGTFQLIAQTVRINDSAAFESGDHAHHLDIAGGPVHRDFDEGGDITALLKSTSHAEAVPRCSPLSPSELLCSCFKNSTQAVIR